MSAMKYGAMDYVQKPFTEDELIRFADHLMIRRDERIARQKPPEIHLVTRTEAETESPRTINVPGGVYVAPEHTWVRVEMTGEGQVGLDDFFHKTVSAIDQLELPEKGARVRRGETLFKARHGDRDLAFPSPLSGRVSRVNHELDYNLELCRQRPYEAGWICSLDPADLTQDLQQMRIGADAVDWYQEEVETFRRVLSELAQADGEEEATDQAWRAFATVCLKGEAEPVGVPS